MERTKVINKERIGKLFSLILIFAFFTGVFGATIICYDQNGLPVTGTKLIVANSTTRLNLTTNGSTGTTVNLINGTNYTVYCFITSNKVIMGEILLANNSLSYSFNASAYNYTTISLPKYSCLNVSYNVSFTNMNIPLTLTGNSTLYTENVSDVNISGFVKEIKKGMYIYKLENITVNNVTYNNTTYVTVKAYENNDVKVYYIRTLKAWVMGMLLLFILALLVLIYVSLGKGMIKHSLKENKWIEVNRKRK